MATSIGTLATGVLEFSRKLLATARGNPRAFVPAFIVLSVVVVSVTAYSVFSGPSKPPAQRAIEESQRSLQIMEQQQGARAKTAAQKTSGKGGSALDLIDRQHAAKKGAAPSDPR